MDFGDLSDDSALTGHHHVEAHPVSDWSAADAVAHHDATAPVYPDVPAVPVVDPASLYGNPSLGSLGPLLAQTHELTQQTEAWLDQLAAGNPRTTLSSTAPPIPGVSQSVLNSMAETHDLFSASDATRAFYNGLSGADSAIREAGTDAYQHDLADSARDAEAARTDPF